MSRCIELLESKTNLPTVKIDNICLYSKYDPIKNIKVFWDNNRYRYEENQSIIIYGLGLGYHILELLRRVDDSFTIYIFDIDTEFYNMFKDIEYIKKIEKAKNVVLHIGNSKENLVEFSKVLSNGSNFLILENILKCIPEENENFKSLLKDYKIAEYSISNFSEKMNRCAEENLIIEYQDISYIIDRYKYTNKPIVLVASGPSLDIELMKMLEKYRDKIIIFSVGRSLRALVNNNIYPDMFCIIDCQDLVYEHIKGLENLDIPMIFLSTANSLTIKQYNGPKYIFYNEDIGQKYVIDTGKSVATAVLDIAIKCSPNKIIFIGQDLAYTNMKKHSEYSKYNYDSDLICGEYINLVESVDGRQIPTTEGLKSFKRWIERKIKGNVQIKYYNCSRGAKIVGTEYIDTMMFGDIITK